MKGRLFFADSSHAERINALRMGEYATARGFAVTLETLKWRESDNESYVLAAETGGELVATMRGEFIESRELLERKLECPWSFPLELEFPVLLLSRAATLAPYRSSGLNLLLRYRFLDLAARHGARFVIGTFVAGSARENTLREMGYRFFENPLGWRQSTYRSLAPVTVAVLDLKSDGAKALSYSQQRTEAAAASFDFEGPIPDLRIVRTI